jgi:hypothetical protein
MFLASSFFDYNIRKLILCSALQGFSRYCTRLMVKRSFGKGDYCRKAQNHLEDCISQGRNFRPWTKFLGARNSMNFQISGPSKFG